MCEIVIDRDIQGGQPILKGTRITVSSVLHYLGEGITPKQLVNRFRANGIKISERDINNVLIFASESLRRTNAN